MCDVRNADLVTVLIKGDICKWQADAHADAWLQEGISTIITAIERSRQIFRRLESYIIYRLASSYLILAFFFLAIVIWDFEMQTWALVLISMFNDLAVMLTAFDKVPPPPHM